MLLKLIDGILLNNIDGNYIVDGRITLKVIVQGFCTISESSNSQYIIIDQFLQWVQVMDAYGSSLLILSISQMHRTFVRYLDWETK